jgi:hypothetical protein
MNTVNINNSSRIKENLSRWDELSPLREQQIKSILLLSQLNQFQLQEADSSDLTADVKFDSEFDQMSSSRSQQKNALQNVKPLLFKKP